MHASREGAHQQMAKQRIQNLEQSLTNHPLALYPHLEKSVPIEVYATLYLPKPPALPIIHRCSMK